MLIKFFARGSGSGRGPVEYVTRTTDPLTKELREPAPEVVAGDPTRTRELIDSLSFKFKYTSGVIAWAPEDQPTGDQQRAVMADFERLAFAGLGRDRYDILWVRHEHANISELHFVVPRVDLGTGKSLNIAPPGWDKTYTPLRDAWNYEQGWTRPDDPERARLLQPGHQALVQASKLRQNLKASPEPKSLITDYLTQRIEAGAISNRAGVLSALRDAGLEINREGKAYVSVRDPGTGAKHRLKGAIYEESFQRSELERTASDQARRGSQHDRETHLSRAAEARRELEATIERRSAFNFKRYGKSAPERSTTVERTSESNERDSKAPGGRIQEHRGSGPQVLDEASHNEPERLVGHLSRELGDDAVPVIVHREPDSTTRTPAGRADETSKAQEASHDLGRGVHGGPGGTACGSAERNEVGDSFGQERRDSETSRPAVGVWWEPLHQAWGTLKERLSNAYDRVREAVVDRFEAIVRAVRAGHEAARGAELALATAGAELGRASTRCREHAPAAGRGLESRAEELDRFKVDISLVDYAVTQGYKVDRRESSRASVVLRGPNEDKLVVATNTNGHGIYFSVRNERDSGSIIDFVQKRQGLNLGQVRKELRPWLSSSSSYRPKAQGRDPYPKPKPSTQERHRVSVELARMNQAGEHRYLKKRGLSEETLSDPRFSGAVRVDGRGNIVFPHRDRHGWCGAELKNQTFTGFMAGGEKGLWVSEGIGKARQLVIVESGLDAMSHAQVTQNHGAGYVSIGGSLSGHQRELLRGMLSKAHEHGVRVVLGVDRDRAGREFVAEISKLAPAGMRLGRDEPKLGKDWNEQLREQEKTRGFGMGMGF